MHGWGREAWPEIEGADGAEYKGYYLNGKKHGHGVYMWPDGRKYNGEYKNNLKHGHGVWTWPDGVMLEGQWAENLPCRHACTIIFSSYVSTDEVQPRIGLDTDTTLHKLWEDAHAWRQEHNVVHSSRHQREISQAPVASPRLGPAEAPHENELRYAKKSTMSPLKEAQITLQRDLITLFAARSATWTRRWHRAAHRLGRRQTTSMHPKAPVRRRWPTISSAGPTVRPSMLAGTCTGNHGQACVGRGASQALGP